MRMIVGLGNRGEGYKNNRHNVGHMFIEYLSKQIQNAKLKRDNVVKSDTYAYETHREKIMLVKPMTYMNESGIVVKKYVLRYKLHVTHDVWIVHDDLDLPLGKYKIQKGKGPKLHNGLLSVENNLGTKDFSRVRIGIDNRSEDERTVGELYVLEDFTEVERKKLERVFEKITKELLSRI
ncbi:MAG TPA: aminoacyl-tRNA hydrolase [Patescibacteria group bacterium]|nr:aminoacyl-tRNA hydrolase [Patescibacteria group bacterium]